MARRLVRTFIKISAIALFAISIIAAYLDRKFRLLPSSLHGFMPQHYHGLVVTDIQVQQCAMFSSCKYDAARWQRIEKDLYLAKAWFSQAYILAQYMKEGELRTEDRVVVDVAIGKVQPDGARQRSDLAWESRPLGIWIQRSSNRAASDSSSAVTAIDVLFGEDAVEPREGWQMMASPLMLNTGSWPNAHLTVRRGTPKEPKKPQLRIQQNGRFRIMQLADLHLNTGFGVCLDAVPKSYKGGPCKADPRTLDFVKRVLDDERPDLVVLSGDQANVATADTQSAIFKYAQVLIERKIPFVTIFGNHDDEDTSYSRGDQMAIVESLPYSLSRAGPAELSGVGNYYVEIMSRGTSDHSAITLYLLDSHAYSPDSKKYPGYDWIKQDQVDWFRRTASGLKKKHSEFTLHHIDLAFIHIPVPEYQDPGQRLVGEYREAVTAPTFNSGFRDALVEQGVVVVSCGHDHVNDYCALSTDSEDNPALWMCYGGGLGFGGYAGYGGYVRRLRLYEVDPSIGRVTTWKRLEDGDIAARIDEQIVVDGGVAVNPS